MTCSTKSKWGPVITVPLLCQAHGLPIPEAEFLFHPTRKFRADWCWPDRRVILEVDGGVFRGGQRGGKAIGGHSSVSGILRDMEKSNLAQLEGYVFLRCTPGEVESGTIVSLLQQVLA